MDSTDPSASAFLSYSKVDLTLRWFSDIHQLFQFHNDIEHHLHPFDEPSNTSPDQKPLVQLPLTPSNSLDSCLFTPSAPIETGKEDNNTIYPKDSTSNISAMSTREASRSASRITAIQAAAEEDDDDKTVASYITAGHVDHKQFRRLLKQCNIYSVPPRVDKPPMLRDYWDRFDTKRVSICPSFRLALVHDVSRV